MLIKIPPIASQTQKFIRENSKKFHIAVFPWVAFGHMIPFLELSKLIVGKGHKISSISTPKATLLSNGTHFGETMNSSSIFRIPIVVVQSRHKSGGTQIHNGEYAKITHWNVEFWCNRKNTITELNLRKSSLSFFESILSKSLAFYAFFGNFLTWGRGIFTQLK